MLLFGLCFPNVLSATESTTPSGIAITDLKEFVDDYVSAYIGETIAGAAIIVLKDQESWKEISSQKCRSWLLANLCE